ncbi:MAG: UPF0280 family protein [Candidatus Bathyarchaeia archaeon]
MFNMRQRVSNKGNKSFINSGRLKLYRVRKKIKESNVLLISDSLGAIKAAIGSIVRNRNELENYIKINPSYQYALDPIGVDETSPRIVKLAAKTAGMAGVGPMAVVSGALADLALEAMLDHGAFVGVVENGGEIAANSILPLSVAIYAGNSPLSGKFGLQASLEDFPIGIATSSATVSHAINFGEADAAIAIADTASLADAGAKRICNSVRGDIEGSIRSGLEAAKSLGFIRGAIVIRGGRIGIIGKLPKFITIEGSIEDVFKSSFYEVFPEV